MDWAVSHNAMLQHHARTSRGCVAVNAGMVLVIRYEQCGETSASRHCFSSQCQDKQATKRQP